MGVKDKVAARSQRAMTRTIRKMPTKALRKLAGDPVEIDGRTLDVRLQLAAKAGAKNPPLSSLPPDVARAGAHDAFLATNGPRAEGVSTHDRPIGTHGLSVRVYQPPTSTGLRPAMLFFHQGGFVIGDLDTCDTFCSRVAAELGAVVVSLDYRLAPEHRFPAQADDADEAWAWLLDHADGLGVDTARLAVAGDSAGGQMTAALCQRLRDAGGTQPVVQLLVYPLTDATADDGSMVSCADTFPLTTDTMEYFHGHALDGVERSDPRLSVALAPNIGGVPPAIVVTAGFDPLRDQGMSFALALRAAGVEVVDRCEDSLSHSFLAMENLTPAATEAVDRVLDDLRPHLTP